MARKAGFALRFKSYILLDFSPQTLSFEGDGIGYHIHLVDDDSLKLQVLEGSYPRVCWQTQQVTAISHEKKW